LQLINFGKRDYDPQLGRWLTTDPAGFVDGTNPYVYLLNCPFRYVDPDGRFVIAIPLVVFAELSMASIMTCFTTYVVPAILATAIAWNLNELSSKLNKRHDDPPLPLDPENDPDWEEISHPNAKANGHRRYKNKKTGKQIRVDDEEDGAPGHGGRRHYHHENPENVKNRKEPKYYDEHGNDARTHSDESHLYHPDQYPGETW
jgi:uncharacterized protein RhaS with RHS repeats